MGLRGQVFERGPADLALEPFAVARLLADEYAVNDPEAAPRVFDLTRGWPALGALRRRRPRAAARRRRRPLPDPPLLGGGQLAVCQRPGGRTGRRADPARDHRRASAR